MSGAIVYRLDTRYARALDAVEALRGMVAMLRVSRGLTSAETTAIKADASRLLRIAGSTRDVVAFDDHEVTACDAWGEIRDLLRRAPIIAPAPVDLAAYRMRQRRRARAKARRSGAQGAA